MKSYIYLFSHFPTPGQHCLCSTTSMDPERHPAEQHPVWEGHGPCVVQQGAGVLCPEARPGDVTSWRSDGNRREGETCLVLYWRSQTTVLKSVALFTDI